MSTRSPFAFRSSSSSLIPLTMNPKTKNLPGVANTAADSARTSTTCPPPSDAPVPREASSATPVCADYARDKTAGAPRYYLGARLTNIVLALVLLALALVAEFRYDRGTWVNPILTPSLTSFSYSVYNVYLVLAYRCRNHPHVRIVYDGICLGTGLAVASGFLTAWAVQDAPDIGYRISAPILVGMYSMAAVQYGLGLNGVYQVVQMRRGRWTEDV